MRVRLCSILAIVGLLLTLLIPSGREEVRAASGLTQTFTGTGTQVTPFFSLAPGIAVFHSTYSGTGNFIVWLRDSNGNDVDLVDNEIDSSDLTTLTPITTSGLYILSVESSGSWSITVKNPGDTLDNPVPEPTTLIGSGKTVSSPVTLSKGLLVVFFNYQGARNFIVTLYGAHGEYIDLVVNQIGATSGSKSLCAKPGRRVE